MISPTTIIGWRQTVAVADESEYALKALFSVLFAVSALKYLFAVDEEWSLSKFSAGAPSADETVADILQICG